MTALKFQALALAIPDAVKGAHMGHADFRVGGKIFATLGYPDGDHGMVKLSPKRQKDFIERAPMAFSPCSGIWGKNGSTSVCLAEAKVADVREALAAARELLMSGIKPKPPAKKARK